MHHLCVVRLFQRFWFCFPSFLFTPGHSVLYRRYPTVSVLHQGLVKLSDSRCLHTSWSAAWTRPSSSSFQSSRLLFSQDWYSVVFHHQTVRHWTSSCPSLPTLLWQHAPTDSSSSTLGQYMCSSWGSGEDLIISQDYIPVDIPVMCPETKCLETRTPSISDIKCPDTKSPETRRLETKCPLVQQVAAAVFWSQRWWDFLSLLLLHNLQLNTFSDCRPCKQSSTWTTVTSVSQHLLPPSFLSQQPPSFSFPSWPWFLYSLKKKLNFWVKPVDRKRSWVKTHL